MSEPSLFDYIGDISYNKKYLYSEDTKKNYSVFMVNRGLGQHIDTIMLANEMNKRPDTPELMHHDFLFYAVDAKKRYGKWAKADDTDTEVVEYVKSTYGVNQRIALDYIKLMDRSELEKLAEEAKNKGGKTK